MSLRHNAKLLSLLTLFILVQGCAAKPVSDSDRDTTGSYDGNWQVLVQRAPAIQFVEKWKFTCNPSPFEFGMIIKDGKASIIWSDDKIETNVGGEGKFAFIIPLDTKGRESGASGESIVNGNRRVLFSGDLASEEGSGAYTRGLQQFAWQGCRNKVLFKKR